MSQALKLKYICYLQLQAKHKQSLFRTLFGQNHIRTALDLQTAKSHIKQHNNYIVKNPQIEYKDCVIICTPVTINNVISKQLYNIQNVCKKVLLHGSKSSCSHPPEVVQKIVFAVGSYPAMIKQQAIKLQSKLYSIQPQVKNQQANQSLYIEINVKQNSSILNKSLDIQNCKVSQSVKKKLQSIQKQKLNTQPMLLKQVFDEKQQQVAKQAQLIPSPSKKEQKILEKVEENQKQSEKSQQQDQQDNQSSNKKQSSQKSSQQSQQQNHSKNQSKISEANHQKIVDSQDSMISNQKNQNYVKSQVIKTQQIETEENLQHKIAQQQKSQNQQTQIKIQNQTKNGKQSHTTQNEPQIVDVKQYFKQPTTNEAPIQKIQKNEVKITQQEPNQKIQDHQVVQMTKNSKKQQQNLSTLKQLNYSYIEGQQSQLKSEAQNSILYNMNNFDGINDQLIQEKNPSLNNTQTHLIKSQTNKISMPIDHNTSLYQHSQVFLKQDILEYSRPNKSNQIQDRSIGITSQVGKDNQQEGKQQICEQLPIQKNLKQILNKSNSLVLNTSKIHNSLKQQLKQQQQEIVRTSSQQNQVLTACQNFVETKYEVKLQPQHHNLSTISKQEKQQLQLQKSYYAIPDNQLNNQPMDIEVKILQESTQKNLQKVNQSQQRPYPPEQVKKQKNITSQLDTTKKLNSNSGQDQMSNQKQGTQQHNSSYKSVQNQIKISQQLPIHKQVKKQQMRKRKSQEQIHKLRKKLCLMNQKYKRDKKKIGISLNYEQDYSRAVKKISQLNTKNKQHEITPKRELYQKTKYENIKLVWIDQRGIFNKSIFDRFNAQFKNHQYQDCIKCYQLEHFSTQFRFQISSQKSIKTLLVPIFTNSNFQQIATSSIFPFENCSKYFVYCGRVDYAESNAKKFGIPQNQIYYTNNNNHIYHEVVKLLSRTELWIEGLKWVNLGLLGSFHIFMK